MSGSWRELRARIERLNAEIERLQAESDISDGLLAELHAEVEQLKAAIAWVLEVHPNKTREGGAVVEMTWDQFNAMRAALEPKP